MQAARSLAKWCTKTLLFISLTSSLLVLGHFVGLERSETASDATREITNELEYELAKAVDENNGSPGPPVVAVETVDKDQTFGSSAEVLDVVSVNYDAEASFQSIERTIEADVDRAGTS